MSDAVLGILKIGWLVVLYFFILRIVLVVISVWAVLNRVEIEGLGKR